MSARLSRFALALGVAVPAMLSAQSFEYAPITAQYRVTAKTSGTQEMMGNKNPVERTASELLTVTVARAAKDTVALSVLVDSISVISAMGPTPGIEQLRGSKIDARLSPAGVVYSAKGPTDDQVPNGGQFTEELSRFLPRIRVSLANGATWFDTLSGKIRQGPVELDRQVIAKYLVVGDTTMGSEKAWKISREATTTMSGSGQTPNGPMTMDGTSTAKSTFYMSQKGVFLGGQGEDQTNVKVILAANGMEIGINTTTNNKIEKVK